MYHRGQPNLSQNMYLDDRLEGRTKNRKSRLLFCHRPSDFHSFSNLFSAREILGTIRIRLIEYIATSPCLRTGRLFFPILRSRTRELYWKDTALRFSDADTSTRHKKFMIAKIFSRRKNLHGRCGFLVDSLAKSSFGGLPEVVSYGMFDGLPHLKGYWARTVESRCCRAADRKKGN